MLTEMATVSTDVLRGAADKVSAWIPRPRSPSSEQNSPLNHATFWENLASGKEKTVFVLDGGGMSGIFTAAMVDELRTQQPELLDNVEAYAGVSVGAINAAYHLGSRGDNPGPDIYYDTFATDKFIRQGRKPGMLDIGY